MMVLNRFDLLPRATKTLVIITLCGYALGLLAGGRAEVFLGFVPGLAVGKLWVWQFATYLFLHGGLVHLLLNLFMLWTLGAMMESLWGPKEFLKFYFLAGAGAAVFHAALSPNSFIPVIGASGAIFGLLAAFAFSFPESTVYLYFIFPLKARNLVILLAVVELAASFDSRRTGIANLAHLGGMATGYVYLRWIKNFRFRKEPAAPPPQTIDDLLDKIASRGEGALTPDEKSRLENYSRRLKK